MKSAYVYKQIDHRPEGNSAEIIDALLAAFAGSNETEPVCALAQEVAKLIVAVDKDQQKASATACPGCTDVCCKNRHAYHEHEDLVYLAALGAKMPAYRKGVPDEASCQFLGEYGCSISRHLRPHRCNSYFCERMLEYFDTLPASEFRKFVADLELVTRKREELLKAACKVMSGEKA